MTITKNAPASDPPNNPNSSIPLASREQTLFDMKRSYAADHIKELEHHAQNAPSERAEVRLDEARWWARLVGL